MVWVTAPTSAGQKSGAPGETGAKELVESCPAIYSAGQHKKEWGQKVNASKRTPRVKEGSMRVVFQGSDKMCSVAQIYPSNSDLDPLAQRILSADVH